MVEIPVRPPRFLGEKVPYRKQTMQENIQSALPGYTVEQVNGQYVAKANTVEYISERRGANRTMSSYVPDELVISPEGQVLKETKRGVYKSDVFEHGQTQDVYESEVTDYQAQSRFTFGKRDLKSGRETIRQTSSLVGGVYKERRIIDQDTKEYELSKRTEEQATLIREQGFLVRRTEKYAVAGMTEPQRQQYYKLKAQQRTAEFSMDAKAQRIARDETQKFQKELQNESSKYVQDIVQKQSERIKESEPQPKPFTTFVSTEPQTSQGQTFQVQSFNPSSPTTRTDLGSKPFLVGGKLPTGSLQEAEKPTGFGVTNRVQDILNLRSSRARAEGKDLSGYGYALAEFGVSVPIGGAKMIYSLMPQNLPETVANVVNPESYRQAGVELATRPTKFSGELVGSVLMSYGFGKGIQAVGTNRKAYNEQRNLGSQSNVVSGSSGTQEFQSKLIQDKGVDIEILNKERLNFLKTKEGKGDYTGTVFASKKVIQDGKVVETPSIEKIGTTIYGSPSPNLGKGFFRQEVTETRGVVSARTIAETGEIKISSSTQQTLSKPQIIATSKWLPGDIRQVTVKGGVPYVPDLFGQGLRPYNSQEFSLSTVYGTEYVKVGLSPDVQSAVGNLRMNYLKDVSSPFGSVTINTRGSPGVQRTLYPKEIVIVRKHGTYPTPAIRPSSDVVVVNKPATDFLVGSESKSVLVQEVAPQKYATAGEVLEGTTKVYPKYQLSSSKQVSTKMELPQFEPAQQTVPQSYLNGRGYSVAGLISFPKSESIQSPKVSSVQFSVMKEESVVQPKPSFRTEGTLRLVPGSISISKNEAKGEYSTISKPISILRSENVLRNETVTETKLDTKLQLDLMLDLNTVTRTTTKIGTRTPPPPIPPEIPPVDFMTKPSDGIKKGSSYSVQVRSKGSFKEVGKATTLKEAFGIGKQKVLTTASASFRVVPATKGENVFVAGSGLLPKNLFYSSKKEPGVFIQRREARISTAGEKREITFKGIQMRRNKNIFGR